MLSDPEPITFVDLLQARAGREPGRLAYIFLADGEEESDRLTYGDLDGWARRIAERLLTEGAMAGERALLLFPPGLEFAAAFLGCLYAGVVAVPAYPPRPGRKADRLEGIAADARPRFALTTAAIRARWDAVAAGSEALGAVRCLEIPERGQPDGAPGIALPRIGPEALAFLQYTSGSTATPKGVEVRHRHLLFMERVIGQVFEQGPESVVVGWLPLYHDMGLIGNLLQPLHAGGSCVLMSPVSFLRRPRRWLEAISRYRATTSGGPSFAYELCAERIGPEDRAGLDLSSWRVAFNGAEPVRAATLARFAEAFGPQGFRSAAFQPCYGLAEATLLVSGSRGGQGPRVVSVKAEGLERGRIEEPARGGSDRAVELVGCGSVPADVRVEIVNPATLRRSGPGKVGEIWVAGPGVAAGYWGRPEETERDFAARIVGEEAGPFLRTGDLGFLVDGELFVTGRLKDLIILRGRNLYPQDIEWTVERCAPELAAGGAAAFSVEVAGEERLVLAQEVAPRARLDGGAKERLAAAVRRAVAEEHEAQVWEVVLLAPGALPKTSSGKVRRRECRRLYLAGSLEAVGRSRLDAGAAGDVEPSLSREGLAALPAGERTAALARELRRRAAALGVPEGELGLDQPLLDLGLDSLAGIDLAHGVGRDFGIELPLEALFDGASCVRLAEIVLGHSSELSDVGAGLVPARAGEFRTFPPPGRGQAPPLHFGQRGPVWTELSYGERALWLLDRLLPPEDASYRLAAAARLPGSVSVPVLRTAFQGLVDRHEALRTTYTVDPDTGEPVRQVALKAEAAFVDRDATGWSTGRLAREVEEEAWRPFDLENGPLLRATVFTGAPEGTVLVVAVHHIVADFGSLALLARQLGETGAGSSPAYSAFAGRQSAELAGPKGEELWDWWRARLKDLPAASALPYDRAPEPGEPLSGPAGTVQIDFGPARTERLLALARRQGVTVYAAFAALQAALLARLTGETDLAIGAPAAGRPSEAVETVGYFANPLVLRFGLSGDPTFKAVLAQAREVLARALAHQDLPFPLLVEQLRREQGGEVEPFRTMLTLYPAPAGLEGLVPLALGERGWPFSLGSLELEPLPLLPRSSQFDFTLSLGLRRSSLGGLLVYHAGRFEPATMRRLAAQLETLLDSALERPELCLSELSLLPEAMRHQLVLEANDRAEEAPAWTSLEEGFEQQARRSPGRTALIWGEERKTYGELDELANRLARRLAKPGVKAEGRVGVLLERSPEMVAALLGVLKAGAAYVPLDPSLPEERLAFLLEDSGASLLVTRAGFSAPEGLPRIFVDEGAPESGEDLIRADRRRNLAYVIYTSGSTGRPKGVEIEHGSALRLIEWAGRTYGAAELAGVLASTSIGFDLSIFELFVPLSFGGTVILAENALALPGLPAASEVTLLNTVPSAMAALLDLEALPAGLLTVNLAGEPLRRSLAERVLGAGISRLYNLYGPSEDTTYSTGWRIEPGKAGEPPIGRPLAGSRAYVMDAALHLVPPGVAGELYLGGDGLARGYLGRPELTAERFVPDPWSGDPGARLYRTGDRVRQRPDGTLLYLGRLDRQLKLRGFRIEPGEVEAILLSQPSVLEAAVVRRSGQDALTAFVVLAEGAPAAEAELVSALGRRLPAPLVPSSVVCLDALPLTPNGKVDRKALEALEPGEDAAAVAPPLGEIEERLAGIWAELLGAGSAARIGRQSRFFDLGGHSLLAARLVARVRQAFGVELPISVAFEAPRLAEQARRIDAGRRQDTAPIPRLSQEGPQPLSFAQERLWFLDQLAPGRAVYNMPVGLRLSGPLDVPALAGALAAFVGRHEALRTSFAVADGAPYAVVQPAEETFPLPVLDVTESEALRRAGEEAERPFDLSGIAEDPLFRAVLLRLGEEEHLLVLVLHHIVADGWSLDVLARELAAGYAGTPLPELPIQYADYAAWQRTVLSGEALAPELAAWTERLRGLPPALSLPGDRPRPPVQTFRGGTAPLALTGPLHERLSALAARSGATPFLVWLAGFTALLSRLTGETDLAVGTAVANRTRVETEELIGLFVNSLVVRGDLSGDPPFDRLLGRTREAALWAFAHQDLPFEKLVEALAPVRALSQAPLFQVMLVAEVAVPEVSLPGLRVRRQPLATGTAKLDLLLTLDAAGSSGELEYNRDLFDPSTTVRLLGQLETLLAASAAFPERRLSELPILPEAQRQQILVEWNAAALPARGAATLPERFAEQARRTPEAVALIHGGERISYRELARRADRMAERLAELGIGPETRVGVLLPRTPDIVASLLGILATGGAYLPLDPKQPPARLLWTLEDAGAALLVSDRDLLLPGWEDRTIFAAERSSPPLLGGGSAGGRGGRGVRGLSGSLAYVIYTSGSTGRPKGVAIEHRSAAAMLDWGAERFSPEELAGVLAATSISFDLSVFEIFLPLTTGGRVILARDALELPSLEAASEVTLVNTVPSAMAEILRLGGLPPSVRTVNLAGEPLPALLAAEIYRQPRVEKVWNLYGPSEDTTYSTGSQVPRGGGPPAIGRPLPGTRACVLDTAFQPAPVGVPGELFLGGSGLARGYLGRPDLTASRFVPDPYGPAGSRLYRTGDLARFRPDGELDFLGRADHQVKVRGFRIELGEIEAVLAGHPAVQSAAVLVEERASGARLVACWAPRLPEDDPEPSELRAFLREKLPEPMVPASFLRLAALPLTPNGKIDRKALAEEIARSAEERTAGAAERPRSRVEERIAAIWCEVLETDAVDPAASFFEIGGHSLLATRVMSRLRGAFGVELPVRVLFESPSVRDLARRVDEALAAERSSAESGPLPPISRRTEMGRPPLSFAQERLWFLDRLGAGTVYNVPFAITVRGALDAAFLAAALTAVARRHEALRTTFAEGAAEGGAVQVIAPPESVWVPLPEIDLTAVPEGARRIEARDLAAEEAGRPFDLVRGPLFRAALLRLAGRESVLLLDLHHIVSDGWSMGVLVAELAALFRGEALAELPVQYPDFAVWQRRWLDEAELARRMGFWRERLEGAPRGIALPADRPRPAAQSFRGASFSFGLAPDLTAGLFSLSQKAGATPFMTLLAGFTALLGRLTGQEDLVIGTPIANRNLLETERLIGFFVNSLALRQDLRGDPTLAGLLAQVRETALAAYAQQDLPFERLVKELAPERHLAQNPLFQVMFALQNAPLVPLAEMDLPGLRLEPFPFPADTAKLDLQLDLTEADTLEGKVLAGELRYATDLFDRTTMERLVAQLRTLLTGAVAEPEARLSDLPLLSEAERHQLAVEWGERTALLDPAGRPVPIGVKGEVWQLEPEERTGEIARRRSDGRLEILGRAGDRFEVRGFPVEPREVELALLRHPEVRDAAVRVEPSSDGRLVAWVVRRAARAANVEEAKGAAAEHVAAWRAVYDETYSAPAADEASTGGEGFAGWTSSYTGLPIPALEMREWQDSTVERILALGGRRVLEIGCGTGLLAVRIAPHVERYRGVDFSAFALDRARRRLERERARGVVLPPVELVQGVADDWSGIAPGDFDLVVINSVAQYFPSGAYLLGVLEAAVAAVSPSGAVFVGDVRSLPLLPAFHASVELATAPSGLSPSELLRRAERRRAEEAELALDPGFFFALAARLPAVRGASVRVKRGRARNELTRFRFDAVLEVGERASATGAPFPGWQDWPADGLSLSRLEKRLAEEKPESLAFSGIPDARFAEVAALTSLLEEGKPVPGAVEDLRRAVAQHAERHEREAVEPEMLVEAGRRAGYAVELTWAAPEEWRSGRFAAVLTLTSQPPLPPSPPSPGRGDGGEGSLANAPLASLAARHARAQAVADLRRFLRAELPEPSVPEAIVLLDEMPLDSAGRIDRGALPFPERTEARARAFVAPRTPVEKALAEIWAELLDVSGEATIGTGDSFFALGGHSLLATQATARVRERFGVELPVRALFEEPTLADLAVRIETARRALLGEMAEDSGAGGPLPSLQRALGDRSHWPASYAQRRLWFLDRLEPGTALYNIPAALAVHGALDIAVLARTLAEIARRHETLRTVFLDEAGEPAQGVHGVPEPFPVPVIDLTGLRAERRWQEAREIAVSEFGTPFDLAQGPLWRVRLLRLDAREHQALLTLHHIVSDGWSTEVLVREVAALYPAFAVGRLSPLPALPVQYGDYAVWQRSWLTGPLLEREIAYWRRQLAGAAALDLPSDRPRAAVARRRGALYSWVVPEALSSGLRALARRYGATLFSALLAGFQALLLRLSGQEEVSVGTPVAGRSHVEIEDLIGFFVNTLVLRVQLGGDAPFRELLARAREVSLAAQAHQAVPFDRLVEELAPERSFSRSPLFEVMFALQRVPRTALDLPGLTLSPLPLEQPAGDTAKFDLTLTFEEGARGLAASFEYSTDLFDRSTLVRWAGHLERLLGAAAENPSLRLSELPLLSGAERHQVAVGWNDTRATPELPAATLYEIFVQQAECSPDAWAVESGGGRLTYGELRARAEGLAVRLRQRGVGPEQVVAVCVERSPALVVGFLGALAAGGVYLPIDPTLPERRRDLLLADSGARMLLSTAGILASWQVPEGVEPLRLDAEGEDPSPALPRSAGEGAPAQEAGIPALPGHAAYLIYTSGSSGRPKGVVVSHEASAWQCRAAIRMYRLTAGDRIPQFAAAGFDVSIEEILPTLAVGATLVLWGAGSPHPADLLADLARDRITVLNLPTAYWQQWAREGNVPGRLAAHPPLDRVIVGGEAMSPRGVPPWEELRRKAFPAAVLFNTYGPTEAVVTATLHEVSPEDAAEGAVVSIGRPMLDRSAWVVDRRGILQPAGIPGELWLGGILARGYLGDPARTAERFVPDAFSPPGSAPGGRLYRTGDLVRWTPAGELSFLGRIDQQVKVRGFRIELGEIETALAGVPGIREAVAVVWGEGEDRRLAAFYVPEPALAGAIDPAMLRDHLRDRLPGALVPSAFVPLAALPITPNGKVDRQALPDPFAHEAGIGRPAGPRRPSTPAEEIVAAIWCDVLELPAVGLGESFFDLGGHSLLATRVGSRLRAAFGIELPLRDLFDRPTVEGLAGRVEEALRRVGGRGEASPALPIERVPRTPEDAGFPLSFAQQRLWFLDQMESGGSAYNIPFAVRLDGPLEAGAGGIGDIGGIGLLAGVLAEVVRRHEALRTRFDPRGGNPVQVIDPPAPLALPLVDLASLPAPDAEARSLAEDLGPLPFDLARGPLVRAFLLRLSPVRHILLAAMHHIVSDEWSMRILLREVVVLYRAFSRGLPSPLPELPVQYADYAVWQRRRLEGDALASQLAFWRERLGDDPPVLELPADRPRPAVQSYRGDLLPLRLPETLARSLFHLSRSASATPFMTLLAAFAALLGRSTGQTDLAIGTPISGRTRLEVEEVIGFFLNTLVLRIDLAGDSGGPSFSALLDQVRERSLAAFAHQDLPFEKLVDELRPSRSLAHSPLFQALFVLVHEAPLDEEVVTGLRLSSLPNEQKAAKFDLSLFLSAEPGALSGSLEYAADLFDRTTISRFAGHFERLLTALAENPDRPVSDPPLTSEAEAQQILREWNDTSAALEDAGVHETVAAVTRRHPERHAVVWDGGSWTYAELAARAGALAGHLRTLGIGPDVPVGVLAERGPFLAAALLGVLQAGGAYLPLDPAFPRERLLYMLSDSGAPVLLAGKGLGLGTSLHEIDLAAFPWDAPLGGGVARVARVEPEDISYLIYTSGSTGRPKGSALPHRALSNLIGWKIGRLVAEGVDPALRTLQLASPSFDVSLEETFATWCAGGTLVVAPEEARRDPRLLAEILQREEVERLFLPFVALQQLAEHLTGAGVEDAPPSRLREVITSGERLQITPQIADLFRRLPGCVLRNQYGPSETHVVTEQALRGDPGRWPLLPPIGRPIASTAAYVLDHFGLPVPAGLSGELMLGGAGLARGYVLRPDLTAERFVPDPFPAEPGARLYRTGDLARFLPDGEIEFLGRVDHQLKIRGFRIEPGEIEVALAAHPQVREAVVVARGEGTAGHAAGLRLVAYVVPAGSEPPSIADLRSFLRERLPEHMIPAAIVTLPALPLTGSGKVQRSALPEPEEVRDAPYVPPATALERMVAEVVAAQLGASQVGRDDNFFDAGAHSLLLVRVAGELTSRLGRKVAVVDLFRFPTVSTLALHLGEGIEVAAPPDRAGLEERAEARRTAADQRRADRRGPSPPVRANASRREEMVHEASTHAERDRLPSQPEPAFEQIAIIGMACRYPGAADPGELWRNLRDGVESITRFTDEELAAEGVSPELIRDPAYVKAAGVLDGPDLFDADFFGFTPREAELMDPQHRLLLECAWQACEDAGYVPQTYAGRIGVYAGAAAGTYFLHNVLTNPEVLAAAGGMQVKLLNDKDFLTTHVSYKLNLRGPSMAVQTACSTSLVAVHVACQALLDGECDMALAGGTGISFPHRTGALYQEGGINSPDGHCRAFDINAQGLVDGNGTGIVLLKRLSQALADGDFIHAVIRGSAVNNDGAQKVGYTAPSVESQSEVIGEALAAARVEADTIGLVEAHGSGTPLGDPIEVQALTRAFRSTTDRSGYCALGSIKTNIGHTDAAAGVAGLLKTVLALEHRQIPPSLHFTEPNPETGLPESPFFVPTRALDWTAGPAPRRAGVSSLGIGGTNAHVVLEEAPAAPVAGPSRAWQLLTVSARTRTALDSAAEQLASHLAQTPLSRFELADVAHTLRVGRKAFPFRRALLCRDRNEAAAALSGDAGGVGDAGGSPSRWIEGTAPASGVRPVAFLFPGLGEHYAGMAAGLYRAEPAFRAAIDRSSELLGPHLGVDLREILLYWEGGYPSFDRAPRAGSQQPDLRRLLAAEPEETPEDAQLGRTAFAHPAVFAVEHALAELWLAWGIRPQAMIGYSLGEYVAACLAGVFSLESALALVAGRARLIDALPRGAMLAVPLSVPETEALLAGEQDLELAAANGPNLTVIAGGEEATAAFARRLAERGIACRRLRTEHAFHSSRMQPAAAELTRLAAGLDLRPPRIPFISNRTGSWITDAEATDPAYWAEHLCRPVRFSSGLETLTAEGGVLGDTGSAAPILLEVGPGQTLGTLARQRPGRPAGETVIASLRDRREEVSDQAFLLDALARLWAAGASPDWTAFSRGERRRRRPLPTYPFERRRYFLMPGKGVSPASLRSAKTDRCDLQDWFYTPWWEQAPKKAHEEGKREPLRWLLLGDGGGLADRLLVRLAEAGDVVEHMAKPSDYRALLQAARENGGLPQRIVHLLSLDSGGSVEAVEEGGFYSLLALAQALAEVDPGSHAGVHVGVVTSGVADVLGEEALVPERATLLGPARVLPQEAPGVTCTVIDLPEGGRLPLADLLIEELALPRSEPLVALRGRRRFLRRFRTVEMPSPERGAARLRQGGVYLITGGLDETGVTLAEQLFRACGARLALIAPEDTPPMSRWGDWLSSLDERSEESRRLRRVLALERSGCDLLVTAADLSYPGPVRQAVELARSRFGKIHGVVHAAGKPGAGLLQWKNRAQTAAALAPKVRGTRALWEALEGLPRPAINRRATDLRPMNGAFKPDSSGASFASPGIDARAEATEDSPLDFFVLFGANSSVTGGLGQTDASAGTAFLDAFAEASERQGGLPVQAVDWAFFRWQTVTAPTPEMAAALEDGLATYGIAAGEMFEAFLRVLASGLPHVVVSTQDLDTLTAELDSFSAATLLEEIGRQASAAHARPDLAVPFDPPRGELEETVARLWREAFGIDQVGRDDNFFELSGNSLLAIQIVTRLSQALGIELSTASLLEAPTVAGLSEEIERLQSGPAAEEDPALAVDPAELERLLREIETLSPEEAESKLARELETLS